MSDPPSLQERTRRIARRLQALEQFIDWLPDDGNAGAPRAGFWEGLSELLHDIARDVEKVHRAPYPLSEWRGQTWETFRAEYDKPAES